MSEVAKTTKRELGKNSNLPVSEAPKDENPKNDWRLIETAPKGKAVLLLLPEQPGYLPLPWPGCWSYLYGKWSIYIPCSDHSGKRVVMTDTVQPTHWMPLPATPITKIEG